MARPVTPIEKRLGKLRLDPETGCWVWTGSQFPNGYGQLWSPRPHRKGHLVHRLVYEIERGPIPEGLVIDHLCRNRLCANPDHLEPVTQRENLLRGNGWSGRNSRRTHCPKGHPLEGEPGSHRFCKVCKYARVSAWQKRNRDRMNELGRASYRRMKERLGPMANSIKKGKVGERQAVALLREITGLDVRRRVRQHDGDSDLEGVPGWSIEVKRDNGLSADAMWKQACEQCHGEDVPLLLYRRDRRPWTARWGLVGVEGWVEAPPQTWWLWVQRNSASCP